MKRARRCYRACSFLLLAVMPAWQGAAAQWTIESVDRTGPGYYTSLKADRSGDLHAAYIPEVPGHPLKYAFWDKLVKRWFTMDVASNASFCTLVLDSKDHPHISYADFGSGLGTRIKYASWDGSWKVEPIDVHPGGSIAYFTSIAFDAHDNPVLTYYDYADSQMNNVLHLGSVFWRGHYWEERTVDRTPGSGKFNSLAIDSTGKPVIAYANVSYQTDSLRFATWSGNAWHVEIIEGAAEPFPTYSVAMVLDKKDNPHIVYTDLVHRLIKYATRRNGKWETEAVDSYMNVAAGMGYWDRNGITVDDQGNPYISYFDKGAGVLKVAHRVNGRWYREIVDNNMAGMTSSLAIADGMLWVSYAGLYDGSFKVASRPLDETAQPVTSETRGHTTPEKK